MRYVGGSTSSRHPGARLTCVDACAQVVGMLLCRGLTPPDRDSVFIDLEREDIMDSDLVAQAEGLAGMISLADMTIDHMIMEAAHRGIDVSHVVGPKRQRRRKPLLDALRKPMQDDVRAASAAAVWHMPRTDDDASLCVSLCVWLCVGCCVLPVAGHAAAGGVHAGLYRHRRSSHGARKLHAARCSVRRRASQPTASGWREYHRHEAGAIRTAVPPTARSIRVSLLARAAEGAAANRWWLRRWHAGRCRQRPSHRHARPCGRVHCLVRRQEVPAVRPRAGHCTSAGVASVHTFCVRFRCEWRHPAGVAGVRLRIASCRAAWCGREAKGQRSAGSGPTTAASLRTTAVVAGICHGRRGGHIGCQRWWCGDAAAAGWVHTAWGGSQRHRDSAADHTTTAQHPVPCGTATTPTATTRACHDASTATTAPP